jgi:hypothetical protein
MALKEDSPPAAELHFEGDSLEVLSGFPDEIAGVLDEYQPSVSNLLRGRISQVSIEKLLRYADRLCLQTSIAVRPIEGLSRHTTCRQKQIAQRPARKLAAAV